MLSPRLPVGLSAWDVALHVVSCGAGVVAVAAIP